MSCATARKQVADQADGLRQLMAGNIGRRVAVIESEPVAGGSPVTRNLAAALSLRGQEVVLLDERDGMQSAPLQRHAALVLVNAVLDKDGAMSPLAANADHILVVLQANAAAVTKAYLCIKRLHYAHALQHMRILINGASDPTEAKQMLANLATTGRRYLGLSLETAGLVREDPLLEQANRLNLTVVDAFPASHAARDFYRLASELLQWPCRLVGAPTFSLKPDYAARSEPLPVLHLC